MTLDAVGIPDAISASHERPPSQQAKSHTRRYQNKKTIRTHLPPGRQGSDYFALVRHGGDELHVVVTTQPLPGQRQLVVSEGSLLWQLGDEDLARNFLPR